MNIINIRCSLLEGQRRQSPSGAERDDVRECKGDLIVGLDVVSRESEHIGVQ